LTNSPRSAPPSSKPLDQREDAGRIASRDGPEHLGVQLVGIKPQHFAHRAAVTGPSPNESTWSSSDSASRIPAVGALRNEMQASASTDSFSAWATSLRRATIACGPMRRKSKRCSRDRIGAAVLAIFCGSVVAKTKTTRGGGSSRIFSSAFHASRVSICASSTI